MAEAAAVAAHAAGHTTAFAVEGPGQSLSSCSTCWGWQVAREDCMSTIASDADSGVHVAMTVMFELILQHVLI